MTTATSVEQIEALPVASVINNGDGRQRRWQRDDNGWRNGVALIPSEFFRNDIAQGRVTIGTRPEVGQVWHTRNGYDILVVRRASEGTDWWVVRTVRGAFERLMKTSDPAEQGGLATDQNPPWKATALGIGGAMAMLQEQRDRDVTSLQQQIERLRQESNDQQGTLDIVQRGMHGLVVADESLRERVDEVLTSAGLSLSPVMRAVSVEVRGTRYITLTPEDVAQYTPEGATGLSIGSTYVISTFPVEVSIEAPADICACGRVTRADVRSVIREQFEMGNSEFSFTVKGCGIEGCAYSNPF